MKKPQSTAETESPYLKNFLDNIRRLTIFNNLTELDYVTRDRINLKLMRKFQRFNGGKVTLTGVDKRDIEISEEEAKFLRDVTRQAAEDYRQLLPFLKSQILIFTVSLFEFYVKDILEYMYRRNISCLRTKDKTLEYDKLLSFNNMNELVDYVIEKESFAIGFLSYDELTNYLFKKWKINLDKTEITRESIEEIFLIRNLLVHNRGRVNRTFLQKLRNSNYSLMMQSK